MADALGITCIAEGIETGAELREVKALGIRLCQGYFLARPATAALPTLCNVGGF